MAKQQIKARPVREVRLGRIRAAIWENETQNGTRHNVTFSRLYKDGDEWKDSTSFGRVTGLLGCVQGASVEIAGQCGEDTRGIHGDG